MPRTATCYQDEPGCGVRFIVGVDVDAIRLYVRDDEGTITQVASAGAALAEDTVEMTFTAPSTTGWHDLSCKADIGAETRTLFVLEDYLDVEPAFGN